MLQKSTFETRGLRNNNPTNIRKSNINWDGETVGTDSAFETFVSMEYGIRAAGKILDSYNKKHGLNTVRGIITRWAPPNENPTDRLIINAVAVTGFGADMKLDMGSNNTKVKLLKALIRQENGINPFSDIFIEKSIGIV